MALSGSDGNPFRLEVRAFLADKPPDEFPCAHGDLGYGFGAWSTEFLRALGDNGLIGITWPEEAGGRNRSLQDWHILLSELAYARAPAEALFYTEAVGFLIRMFGSEGVRTSFLPRMLSGEITFAEALSEPGAGSDLLALRTKAVEDADDYVVDGQKIWISNGWIADYALLAARTDPEAPRHLGISVFLVDLTSEGITRRPIEDLVGFPSFAEIFFDGVRIPKRKLIGDKNKGFQHILDLLEWDRLWGRSVKPPFLRRELHDLIEYCKNTQRSGRSLWEDPAVRSSLAGLLTEIEVSDAMFRRAVDVVDRTGKSVGHEVSMAKVFADELGQRFYRAAADILGLVGQSTSAPLEGRIARGALTAHGVLLAGGSPEVQRITIATRGLGLPR